MKLTALRDFQELTPEWLTSALQQGAVLSRDNRVTEMAGTPIGSGAGYASRMAKYQLAYAAPAENAPQSVVIKIEPGTKEQQEVMETYHTFEREIRFYQEIAPSAPIRIPKVYSTVATPPCYAIVMEDLSHCTPGDQLKGMTASEVASVATMMAKLQAQYWDSAQLSELSWMPTENDFSMAFEESHWSKFLEKFGGDLDQQSLKDAERFRKQIHWIYDQLRNTPKTIVHGDLRQDNILFGPPGTEDEYSIVDWQVVALGCGAFDIARLMGGSEPPSERKGHQLDVLKSWHDTLLENGVQGYSFEEAIYHLKLCSMSYCCLPVYFHPFTDISGSERIWELLRVMSQRAFSAVTELKATEVLPT